MKLSDLPSWFLEIEDSAEIWKNLDHYSKEAMELLKSEIVICYEADGMFYLLGVRDLKELKAWCQDEDPFEPEFVYDTRLNKFYGVQYSTKVVIQ